MQSHKFSELKIPCDCRSDLEQEHKHFDTYLPLSEDSFYIFQPRPVDK